MKRSAPAGSTEFLINMGLLMCLVALSIDSILPALGAIEADLALAQANDRQWVLTALFIGFAAGQLLFGPLGDRFGRKPIITIGMMLALAGALLCSLAGDFQLLLLGRLIQGFGIAAPRILSVAMVRDRYEGAEMARAMALVSTVFLLAPVVAPSVGQLLLSVLSWRALCLFTGLIGMSGVVWMLLRQRESLPQPVALRPAKLLAVAREVLTHRQATGITLASAIMYGGMLGHLASSQQLYQDIYRMGQGYALLLGAHGGLIAVGLWLNRPLTRRLALTRIVEAAALFMLLWSGGWLLPMLLFWQGAPPLWAVLLLVSGMALALGFQFGNLAAIALQPLGHVAANATAIQNALSTSIALSIAAIIGAQLAERFLPIAVGYALTSLGTYLLIRWSRGARIET